MPYDDENEKEVNNNIIEYTKILDGKTQPKTPIGHPKTGGGC